MAKKKSKKAQSKRNSDLFRQLRKRGVSKSAADQIARAAAAVDSGADKVGEAVSKAVDDFRALAADLEKHLPGGAKGKATAKPAGAKARSTRATAKRSAKPAAKRSAKPAAKRAKRSAKPAAKTAKRSATATNRSAAAKKAAATRKRNAAKRSAAAKKGASTRASKS